MVFAVKNVKPPFFFTYLWLLRAINPPPPIPLIKCECIYFCAKVPIWINLGEKYGTKFALLIYYKKNVDF